VEASGFTPLPPVALELKPGSTERFVTLEPLPGTVTVTVVDGEGRPQPCEIRVDGPESEPPQKLGPGATAAFTLYPGKWRFFATAPGFGVEMREVDVRPGATLEPLRLALHPAQVTVEQDSLVIRDKVHFQMAQATPSAAESAILDEVSATLLSRPDVLRVEIQGHTDVTGDLAYNMVLSTQRANAVRAALIARGVPQQQLLARGYGPQRPRADNATEEGRASNRRVEFVIVESQAR
jgi:outer membrane protein OmpA-like peptidoglycan-associated protein